MSTLSATCISTRQRRAQPPITPVLPITFAASTASRCSSRTLRNLRVTVGSKGVIGKSVIGNRGLALFRKSRQDIFQVLHLCLKSFVEAQLNHPLHAFKGLIVDLNTNGCLSLLLAEGVIPLRASWFGISVLVCKSIKHFEMGFWAD